MSKKNENGIRVIDMSKPEGFFKEMEDIFGPVAVYTYTRAEAIEDGVLVDLSAQFPEECGLFKWPVACTAAVWNIIEQAVNDEETGNSYKGVIWDMMWMARFPVKTIDPSTILYDVIITGPWSHNPEADEAKHRFKVVAGPGDTPEPVITIMLPDED